MTHPSMSDSAEAVVRERLLEPIQRDPLNKGWLWPPQMTVDSLGLHINKIIALYHADIGELRGKLEDTISALEQSNRDMRKASNLLRELLYENMANLLSVRCQLNAGVATRQVIATPISAPPHES